MESIDGFVEVQADGNARGFELYSNGRGVSALRGQRREAGNQLIAPPAAF